MKQPRDGIILLALLLVGCAALLAWTRSPDPAPQALAPIARQSSGANPEGPAMRIDPGALDDAGEERDDNGLGMSFCWCPPGSFHMGDAPGSPGGFSKTDRVSVTLSRGFWMGKFEVTQALWHRVMGVTLDEQRAKDPGQPRPVGDGTMRDHVGKSPDYPIYFVSHAEAEEFCRRMTEDERRAGRLTVGWDYRLPTEAQWEFACRAGTTTATAFGDQLGGADANIDGTKPMGGAPAGPYLHETTPVGHYRPNAWGIHDMHGNVWEWCRDGFEPNLPGGLDPIVVASSDMRASRGGCWHNGGRECQSSSRVQGRVDGRGSGRGFRVALAPITP